MFRYLLVFFALIFSFRSFAAQDVDYLIYVYMCGSDLETQGGAASADIEEMIQSNFPKSSKLLVLTGGANQWQLNQINSRSTQIFEVGSGRLNKVETFSYLNMGNVDTLAKFLSYGESRYNPKKRIIIFWDHGAGPIGGVCYDEKDDRFLKLPDITAAFKRVYGKPDSSTFEIVGFDACLMASMDTAFYMSDWGKYLVASEEMEPGTGWHYTPWLNAMAKDKNLDGIQIGKLISDTFITYNHNDDTEDVTMSVIDLAASRELAKAYMEIGSDLVNKAAGTQKNRNIFTAVERSAQNSEKYGIPYNSESIDLKHFIKNLANLTDTSKFDSLFAKTVVYHVNGRFRRSEGISVYYPVKKRRDAYSFVSAYGMPNPFLMLNGAAMGAATPAMIDNIAQNAANAYNYLSSGASSSAPADNTGGISNPDSTALTQEAQGADTGAASSGGTVSGGGLVAAGGSSASYDNSDEDEDSGSSGGLLPAGSSSGTSVSGGGLVAAGSSSGSSSGGLAPIGSSSGSSSSSGGLVAAGSSSGSSSGGLAAIGSSSQDNSDSEDSGYDTYVAPTGHAQGLVAVSGAALGQEKFSLEDIGDLAININDDYDSYITLPESVLDNVATVSFMLSIYEKPKNGKDGISVYLGTDDTIEMDWDKGVFTDKFDGQWACLGDHPLPLYVTEFTDDYTLYEALIKVNDTKAVMTVSYNYDKETYDIVNVVKASEDGIPSRQNIKLKQGDKITTVFYATPVQADENAEDPDPVEFDYETFEYNPNEKIENQDLGDGTYCLLYEVTSLSGESIYSDPVIIQSKNGELTIWDFEEFWNSDEE